ncbi:hypothetical protein [Xanthomonas campestris]|uniref:hypothetical protein n=1 Tax=Xanthomonas campestris TaxID=339 RepID=UPI002B223852|nr:hypothetical protein [Xanthomonas campestris]MEA9550526.1 hypothetical protein [Xanthomonas campestris]MEA9762061.1 hypothetical protein [Xanthomonas campestris pv. raphani]MEA9814665.1 hypothetical protein [Xanthomonas campestris pv. raphani]MEA9907798.1 hypothetical protein [Xanthomonas campestris pv. raphani]MEA9924267.1 hypothetical protein [Xanthomonas campestris pv. raphani]
MARPSESAEQLRERILRAMQQDIGISEHMAQPFIESIMRCFAGEQPYFPSVVREYPVLLIRAALERGEPVKAVMRSFDISRSKLHQLFPGGLPTRENRGMSTVSMKSATK